MEYMLKVHGVHGVHGAQWAEGFKNEIFCLRILISWAQIDRWGLIRRGKIRNCSEILLL